MVAALGATVKGINNNSDHHTTGFFTVYIEHLTYFWLVDVRVHDTVVFAEAKGTGLFERLSEERTGI